MNKDEDKREKVNKWVSRIVISWDFCGAIIIWLISYCFLPLKLKLSFTTTLYSIGVTTLAIVFSVYFAALAVIVSGSNDSFIRFLQKLEVYSDILNTFKVTLFSVFISLLFSIYSYFFSSRQISHGFTGEPKWRFTVFILLFAYSLFASFKAAQFSIRYAGYRGEFLEGKDKGGQSRDN